ncbi:MAG: 2TM domain-containing protein [Flavobacteriaceae bacterium]|nr:2TM domain-containing protein [Flavobacteriaceae bacterium]
MLNLFKEIGKAFFIGSIVFIIIGLIRYNNGYTYSNGKDLLIYFAYNQLYSVVLYLANGYFFKYVLKNFKDTFFTLKTVLILIIGVIGVTMVSVFFIRITHEVIFGNETLSEFVVSERPQDYYITVFIAILVSLAILVFFYYKHLQENKVKEQKIIAGTASAKFDALKNQLDPHFLFNSLNVLTSLIEENPEAATKFTTSLSKVYRYVLEQKNKDLVSVEEELKFARLYMLLIKMRFEDSIVFTLPENLSNPEAKVVPLSLQLLLENAVKHNVVTESRKLHIIIKEEEGNLVVTNNIQPKQVIKSSTGVGLLNIRQRYQLLTNRPVLIKKDENIFSISIPLLTKKNTVMETQDTYISKLKYKRAKDHIEKLKGFYIHLTVYLIMMPVFIFLNFQSTGFPWAIFPIVGWGFGLTGHAMETFDYYPFLGKNWEERKLKEFMNEDDK